MGDEAAPLEPEEAPPKAVESVWLMSISCCSWFIENIWLTIVVGSIGEVGSWDCNSVTSNWMKVCSALFELRVVLVGLLEAVELVTAGANAVPMLGIP